MKNNHRNRCDEILALIDRCLADCEPVPDATRRSRTARDHLADHMKGATT